MLGYFYKGKDKQDILEYLSSALKKLADNASIEALAGIELLKTLGFDKLPKIPSEAHNYDAFTLYLGLHKLYVLRLSFNTPEVFTKLKANITMVANELLQFKLLQNKYIYLDFIFTRKGFLIGILPIPVLFNSSDKNLNELKTPKEKRNLEKMNIEYYDCCELWIDLLKLQNGFSKRFNYIKKYHKKSNRIKKLLSQYIKTIYGHNASVLKAYGKVVYIFECKRETGWTFKHFSLDELKCCFTDGRLNNPDFTNSSIYVSLPGAYVPGKYIDIGYYDAIDGKDINIGKNDTVFVIGFGAGLDLIHSLKKANTALAVEINPFGVASAKANLKVLGLQDRAFIIWEDIREIADGNVYAPDKFHGKITRLLWNIPYESMTQIENPLSLKGFYDNYSLFNWFVPYLIENKLLAVNWRALFWKIADDNNVMEGYFTKHGFKIDSNNEENICIVTP